jgi:hypothetical protein
MSDIATRLRQTRANMIGTEDEQHYWDCYDAAAQIERLRLRDGWNRLRYADEIERLRLTDAEREAVAYYVGTGGPDAVDSTLRGLLERLK